LGYNLL
jgi:hypothetical protein